MRLTALASCVLLAACASTPSAHGVHALHWTGEATVFAGERRIELGVETHVEPFVRARSDTWLRDPGKATLRTLEVGPDGGAMTRDGKRTPMPEAMLAHERLQYATYGWMLPQAWRASGTTVTSLPTLDGLSRMRVERAGAAASTLSFDADGRLVALENAVPDPEGHGVVQQRFTFEGEIVDDGVRWPRTIRIAQDGKPYFELRIATFDAE